MSRDSNLYTDESRLYTVVGKEFETHKTTKHSPKEYSRREGDVVIHSNTIEGVFSVFKRGMVGVYQHCGEAHLHRYLAEFDLRYNRRTALKVSDAERAAFFASERKQPVIPVDRRAMPLAILGTCREHD